MQDQQVGLVMMMFQVEVSAVIDKYPIYMARFENSYEQLAMYNSYQYNIDQLIEVPREEYCRARNNS